MLEIQTTNEQKGFHLAEWLLRLGAMVSLAVFPPLRCTPPIYLQLYLKSATMMVIDTVGSFYIIFFASEDPAALLCSSQIDQKEEIIDFLLCCSVL